MACNCVVGDHAGPKSLRSLERPVNARSFCSLLSFVDNTALCGVRMQRAFKLPSASALKLLLKLYFVALSSS